MNTLVACRGKDELEEYYKLKLIEYDDTIRNIQASHASIIAYKDRVIEELTIQVQLQNTKHADEVELLMLATAEQNYVHASEIKQNDIIYNATMVQKDALIQQWMNRYADAVAQVETQKSDYEDAIALNLLEFNSRLVYLQEKIKAYEESSQAFELKCNIKKHNEEMLVHVQKLRDTLLGQGPDSRAELLFEDLINSMMHDAIELRNPRVHVFISDVACQMGYTFTRNQLASVGVPIAKRYRSITGENPGKHSQFVDGKVNMVNSYTDEFRGMIQEELRKAWGANR